MKRKTIITLLALIATISMGAKVVTVTATKTNYMPPKCNEKNMTTQGWNNNRGDEPVSDKEGGYLCCTSINGDPQVQLLELQSNLSSDQNYIVFDYKSDNSTIAQIFFVKKGGGPSEANSQNFILPKTSEWTTYALNVSSARSKAGWGSTEDYIRFDPSNAGNITQSFRKIRIIATNGKLPHLYGDVVLVADHDGTVEIGTADELAKFSQYLRGAYTTHNTNITTGIRLTADIDMKNRTDYFPIGYRTGENFFTPYTGTFDGQGHEIKNLAINTQSEGGLIGRIQEGGVIKNVGVYGATIKTTGERAGVICGAAVSATISNCYSAGTVTVEGGTFGEAGGIVGKIHNSTLTNCYSSHSNIAATTSGQSCVIDNCYYVGDNNGTTKKSIESGETCHAINGGFNKANYFQKIGSDNHPVLKSSHGLVIESCGGLANYKAPQSDTWVCVDGLGRTVASSDSGVDRAKKDETCSVGMFYYIWHGQHGAEVKDITRLLEANPTNPAFGGKDVFHWGGKPAMGYYAGNDKFIIARHMQQLVDAGIDFYYLDVTNAFTYDANVQVVLDEIDRRISLGLKYPKIVFCCHSGSANVSLYLHNRWYSDPKNNHYWFYWNGKPLMLIDKSLLSSHDAAVRKNLTLRGSWAWEQGEDQWPWLAFYPQQHNYSNETGSKVNEQMIVASAMHAYSKIGKSYHNGAEPAIDKYGLTKYTSQGLFFEEQFKQAIATHPKVLMITQWNEWMAQRFITDSSNKNYTRPGATPKVGESYFVDVYNQEFSRDIEPSSESLIRDNYYMQLVSNVRKYRGVTAIPVPTNADCKAIDINGGFEQWANLSVVYSDEPGDCAYTSTSAQKAECRRRATNDIILCKVTKDSDKLYFYAQVKDDSFVEPSSEGGETWMTLLLNSDAKYNNGWEGYDYKLARDGNNYYLYTWNSTKESWVQGVQLEWFADGNEIMLSVARNAVGINADTDFDFKWVDNTPANTKEILDFLSNGDTAPNARFNYRYKGSKCTYEIPAGVTGQTCDKEQETTKYNLKGQPIMAPQKGEIYIMGGNKYVSKLF